ncbi:MAG: hypothetical protein Q8P12_03735 [bacterium]|nr:hypothetical protein [bacterium]
MKFKRYILPVVLLALFLGAGFAAAQLEPLPEGPQDAEAVLAIIVVVTNWVFAIFLSIAVIFLIWGAFEFVTGTGDPQKIDSAKKRLLYAVIGIGLALLANGVDDVLRSILT